MILRNLRVLKPLRSVEFLPKSKEIADTLMKTIPGLLYVIILLFYFFLTFAILGTTMFSGS